MIEGPVQFVHCAWPERVSHFWPVETDPDTRQVCTCGVHGSVIGDVSEIEACDGAPPGRIERVAHSQSVYGHPQPSLRPVDSRLVTTAPAFPASCVISEPLADSLRRGLPLVWARGAGPQRRALLGWGEAFRATAAGPDRFSKLQDAFASFAASQANNPVAFVTAAFADDSASDSVLIVPALLGRWDGGVLTVTPNASTADLIPPPHGGAAEFEELEVRPGSLSRQGYRQAVAAAVNRLAEGELAKVVLARDLEAVAAAPLDVNTLLLRLQDANPQSYTFHVDGMVGSSPELLVSVAGRRVRSQALAGSAPVTGNVGEDDVTATRLVASGKNHAEHLYAAESVAEKLAAFASVQRSDPHVLRLPRIMHLATDISGELRTSASALTVAGAIHPSAAVCGTPTELAASVLAELEGFDRGRYAGPVGWMDAAGEGEFAIALRCGQVSPDGTRIRLFAGGGIVAGSDPNEELAETARKFLPMYEALSPVDRP